MIRSNNIGFVAIFILLLASCNEQPKEFSYSKQDRIDLAIAQEVMLTKDPNLGYVPRERLLLAKEYTADLISKKAAIQGMDWEERGPSNVAGRTRVLHFDLSDPSGNKVWAASVGGGIWVCNNFMSAQPTWNAINDFFDNIAISCFVQDPSNHNIMYFGTGEGWFNFDAIKGLGVWKSVDGGATWNQLPATAGGDFDFVQDLLIANNVLYASTRAAGVQRSTDGGITWSQVLGSSVGWGNNNQATDLEVASNGDVYAALGINADGYVFKSDFATFGSNTGAFGNWTNITPTTTGTTYRRMELCTAPSDPTRVYAFCQSWGGFNPSLVFFSSNNSGNTWTQQPTPQICDRGAILQFTRNQGWYNLIASVDPTNPNVVYAGGVDLVRSDDGGTSWNQITSWTGGWSSGPNCNTSADTVHADHHAIAFAPTSNNALAVGTDGGVYFSQNANATSPNFIAKNNGYNVTQFYAGDLHPGNGINEYLAGAQDNGTQRLLGYGLVGATEASDGDGGFCHIDQNNPNIQISSYVGNNYWVTTDAWGTKTQHFFNTGGSFINPTDYDDQEKKLYGGHSLTSYFRWNNPASSGNDYDIVSLTGMNATITHVKVSPTVPNRIYLGCDNGDVLYIDDAHIGTSKVPVIIKNGIGSVSCIEIDANNENHLLVTYSNYGVNSVFETINGGTAWTNVAGNLPDMPVRWVIFSPEDSTQALIATELGVWTTDSLQGAATIWGPSNSGLANVRVDMIKCRNSDKQIVAATHGRGLFTTKLYSDLVVNFSETMSIATEDNVDGILTSPNNCLPYTDYSITVRLSKKPGTTVGVDFSINSSSTAIENQDFEILETSPLVFAADEESKEITCRVFDDGSKENTETIILDVVGISPPLQFGTLLQHTISVFDNEANPYSANNEQILAETFGGGLPASWTLTDYTGGGNWAYNGNNNPFNINSTTSSDGFMVFDSYGYGFDGIPEYAELALPVLDCSNYTNVQLSFEQYYRKWFNDITSVEVSNDGVNFVTFQVANNASMAPVTFSPNPELVAIDISAMADGQATVYIKFTYIGDYDEKWEIDDVVVSGDIGVQVETILAESDNQYVGANDTVHFYGGDGEIMATIINGNYDYGCTTVELVRAGNVTHPFWNTNPMNEVMSKVVRIIPTNNAPAATDNYQLTLYYHQSEMSEWENATNGSAQSISLIQVTDVGYAQITPSNATYYPNVLLLNTSEANFGISHYQLTATSSGFSDFLAGIPGSPNDLLPVDLLTFEGERQGNDNKISWITATEINNEGFWLQKASDGVHFERVAWIDGHGNSSNQHEYDVIDKGVSERMYYRLLQVDFNGMEHYSNIISVKGSELIDASLHPNPFNDQLRIQVYEQCHVQVFNLLGELIYNQLEVVGECNINTTQWSQGAYWLVLKNESNREVFKILKEK